MGIVVTFISGSISLHYLATYSSLSYDLEASIRLNPCLAKSCAVVYPIPSDDPVTIAYASYPTYNLYNLFLLDSPSFD